MAGSARHPRIAKDIAGLIAWAGAQGTSAEVDETEREASVVTVIVTIRGPEETPYAGGVYRLRCQLPLGKPYSSECDQYPYKSPSIVFLTKIWHPNIEPESGSICLDIIKERWTCVIRLADVFALYIPQLLSEPNPSDPFNLTAANMMQRDGKQYLEYTRMHARKHALGETHLTLPAVASRRDAWRTAASGSWGGAGAGATDDDEES